MAETKVDLKLCGALKLLSAVFVLDQDKILVKYGIIPSYYVYCAVCEKLLKKSQCYGSFYGDSRGRYYCSKECKDSWLRTKVSCAQCGKLIIYRTAYLLWHTEHKNQQLFFCDRKCQGKWLGHKYGRSHLPKICMARKYNYDLVWQTHLMTGYGAPKIAKLLGIPRASVDHIFHKKRTELIIYNKGASL